MSIKDEKTERLAAEVATMAGESKTEAIRQALIERKAKLAYRVGTPENRYRRAIDFLEREVWPLIPPGERGRTMSREEEDEILGYGEDGV